MTIHGCTTYPCPVCTGQSARTITAPTATATVTFRNQPRVTFADWRSAVDFAFVIAPQSNGVRVSRIGAEWAVEWTALTQPNYVPTVPYYPPGWQYPMRIINGGVAS